MSKRIELTDTEREAAAEAAYIAHEMAVRGDGKYAPWANQDWSQPKWRSSIDAAIAAANRVRAGDPVGTIRRDTNGNIAVRTNYLNGSHLAWRVYSYHYLGQQQRKSPVSTEQWIGPAGECDWPVIYAPEAEQ